MRTPAPDRAAHFVFLLRTTALAISLVFRGGAGSPAHAQPVELRAGDFVVTYWPGHERLASRLLEEAPALARLPALPDSLFSGRPPVRIYVAPDEDRLTELAGGRVPEWGAGVAIPATGVIVLPVYGRHGRDPVTLLRVLRHELAHVALHRQLAPARPPRWFDEGYARWAAGEFDVEGGWQLRLAFAFQRAPPLDSLSLTWPEAHTDARVAYLLAASTVSYLVDRSGERGLALFLERWRDSGDLEVALRQTYGVSLGQFEEHWRADVRRRYGWTQALTHALVFWFFAALLLFILFARRRRRDRQRLAVLRETEPPDSPAFWIVEEEDAPDAGQPPPSSGDSPGEAPESRGTPEH